MPRVPLYAKHGGWLNITESEPSAPTRQCVHGRRIGDLDELSREVAAWATDVNDRQRGVEWQMTAVDARCKLKSVCPKIMLLRNAGSACRNWPEPCLLGVAFRVSRLSSTATAWTLPPPWRAGKAIPAEASECAPAYGTAVRVSPMRWDQSRDPPRLLAVASNEEFADLVVYARLGGPQRVHESVDPLGRSVRDFLAPIDSEC